MGFGVETGRWRRHVPEALFQAHTEQSIDNLLVRIHFIIVMIRWTGLAPWELTGRWRRQAPEALFQARTEQSPAPEKSRSLLMLREKTGAVCPLNVTLCPHPRERVSVCVCGRERERESERARERERESVCAR